MALLAGPFVRESRNLYRLRDLRELQLKPKERSLADAAARIIADTRAQDVKEKELHFGAALYCC